MQSVYGKVVELLRDAAGRVNGFVLDGGEAIRSSADQLDLVAAIVTVDSRIQVSGELQDGGNEQEFLTAAQITNLDSRRTASLPAPVCLGKPGMLSDGAPNRAASLAHPMMMEEGTPTGTASYGEGSPDPIALLLEKMASQPRSSRYAAHEDPQRGHLPLRRAMRGDAATEIDHAYDSLHRIQAILAYLHIMKLQVHGISQMHEEAKHTYEQALSGHAAGDFEGAREFAAASGCLARIVEGVISRTLRSDTSYPSLVPPPPEHTGICGNPGSVEDDLNSVEVVLARVHWLLENGTLPLEHRTQVRKIVAWSDAFYQQARRMYERESHQDAAELVQAAVDAAHSAEYVCRNWYVGQLANSENHMISPDQSALV